MDMSHEERFEYLFNRYCHQTADASETEEWMALVDSGAYDTQLIQLIDRYYAGFEPASDPFKPEIEERMLRQVLQAGIPAVEQHNPYTRRLYRLVASAAAIVLAVAFAIYFVVDSRRSVVDSHVQHVIQPGGNRATLTLADGRTVELSTDQDGIIVGNGNITYSDGTEVLSQEVGKSGSPEDGLPTTDLQLTTPKGGTYQIILSDGTRVWLNAGSTLRYPVRFTGSTRTVEIAGEAYFAVDSRQSSVVSKNPFHVKSKGQEAVVLGTEFNISAYPDENEIKTTLVNGSIKVTVLGGLSDFLTSGLPDSEILKPGEQGILSETGLQTKNVDINSEIAWKNGLFVFRKHPLTEVMRQLSRWYDVEVEYKIRPGGKTIGGTISRSENLDEVLQMLAATHVAKFKTEGKKIIVY